jgi:taurine dioxygenase
MVRAEVQELNPAIGVEILGVDLRTRLDDVTIALLRGHAPPTGEEAQAGAARQGSFMISNKVEGGAAPFGRLLYHCDGMWSDEPFEVLSLLGVGWSSPPSRRHS